MTAPDGNDILRRRPSPPFPFTVLTGFLGAGKTTLLNRLLRDPALADTLVLINEFGEAGLDHLLVEKVEGDLVLMASGCVCCTIRGELADTLEDILRRHDNGRMKPFRRVLVETTGLADPAPLLHTVMNHPYLSLRFRLEGVLTLVDALNGMKTLDEFPEAVKQAAMADVLIVAKVDLCETAAEREQLEALRGRLKQLNPPARLLDAAKGEADATRLLDTGLYNPAGKTPQVRRWLNAEAFGPALDAARNAAQHGAAFRHDSRIQSFVIRDTRPIAAASLQLFLDMLRQLHGASLLRVKGIVALADDPARPVVVHGVQHIFHPAVRLDAWPEEAQSGAGRETKIVMIVRDMDPAHVRALWTAFNGGVAIDTPDIATLSNNPLKPAPGGFFA